jgi:hypothetical protein
MRGRRLHLTAEFGGLLRGGPRPEKGRPCIGGTQDVLTALLGAGAIPTKNTQQAWVAYPSGFGVSMLRFWRWYALAGENCY